MPKLALDEVQRLVDQNQVSALALDTTVFDQFGCNLDYRQLTALKQFKGTAVTILLSEVTLGEVRAHIERAITEASEKARAGVNQYAKAWRGGEDVQALLAGLGISRSAGARAGELVDLFVKTVGAVRLAVEPGVSVAEITERYFGQRPPFSTRTSKKNEFPDAIALLSLESWARERGTYIVAVSKDGDWQRFAAESDHLAVVADLSSGLNLFNRESSVAAARIAATIRSGSANALYTAIYRELERLIEDFDVLASAPYYYEEENDTSSVIGFVFPDNTTFDVVAADEDTISLAAELEMEAEFTVNFSFSTKDPIDRDQVDIGSSSATVTEKFRLPIVATFLKESEDDPEPLDVEVEARSLSVDFGYVEPDWGGDDY